MSPRAGLFMGVMAGAWHVRQTVLALCTLAKVKLTGMARQGHA